MQDNGVTLSRKKIQLGETVRFGGFQLEAGKDGMSIVPDPQKVQGIRDFSTPATTQELRSFLGLAGTLAQWNPDYAHTSANLRKLVKKNVEWVWDEVMEEEFQRVKEILFDTGKLRPFDISLASEVYTDATKTLGIGFILCQVRPERVRNLIWCGSTGVPPTQSRYATMELKCMEIHWAIKNCSFYLRGAAELSV
jgi:hypothetical protein